MSFGGQEAAAYFALKAEKEALGQVLTDLIERLRTIPRWDVNTNGSTTRNRLGEWMDSRVVIDAAKASEERLKDG